MSTHRHPARIASLFSALLVAMSILTLIPTPAGAVQTPESVVVNPDPADWTPHILDGQVNAILQMGSKVVVGGTFTQVRRAGFSADLHAQLPVRVRHGHRRDRPQLRPRPERRGRGAHARPGRNLGLRRRRLQHRQRPELQEARAPEPRRRQHRHQLQGERERLWSRTSCSATAGSTSPGSSRSIKSIARSGLARLEPDHRQRRPEPRPAVHRTRCAGTMGVPGDRRQPRTARSSWRSGASARSRASRGCRSRCST